MLGLQQYLHITNSAELEGEMSKALIRSLRQEKKLRISPRIWPGRSLENQPGDLTEFAPYGNGVYGYQARSGSSELTSAPLLEATGGAVYFDNRVCEADFQALMRILDVERSCTPRSLSTAYAAFIDESPQPRRDGYLAQMRVVSKFGLRHMFGALTDAEYDSFPAQGMTVTEALWSFIEAERERWGTSFTQDDEKGLRGLMGGDGDYAREELAFGFMVENEYNRVYRIWSRVWLVTK